MRLSSTQEFTRNAINNRKENEENQNKQNSAVASYNFDPIFVEDPLNRNNNVGRNAFRINQILRAFSDAHRSLLSSLEFSENDEDYLDYDEYGDGGNNEEKKKSQNEVDDIPLLACLLNNDDAFIY